MSTENSPGLAVLGLGCGWRPVDRASGVRSCQTIRLTGPKNSRRYPAPLRRIHYFDAEKQLRLVFLTNNFQLQALTIAQLYRARWQVELFFRWIKQHLRIRAFYGTSPNAVKTQVWVAITVYVLVAILKKQLYLDLSLYKILQILSVTIFEKTQFHWLSRNTTTNLYDQTLASNWSCSTYDGTVPS